MAPKLETARASPKLKEKSKQVAALEAEVNAMRAKEGALAAPTRAYPPTDHYQGKSDRFRGDGGTGYAGHGMQVDLRTRYAQQKAIVEAELVKEREAIIQKLHTDYETQLRHIYFQLEEMKLKRMEEMQLKREIRLRDEMDYRAKVGKKEDIVIVTTPKVPGYSIKDVCGAVMGFGLIDAVRDEDDEEADNMEEELLLSPHLARVQAVEHMVTDAQRCHANAIVSFHWIIRPLDAFRTKVLAQGTAVVLERVGPVQCGECGTVKKKQKGEGGDKSNEKGNSGNCDHTHDHSAVSVDGPPTANALKQQQQQQKSKGGAGANNGGGGAKGQAVQQQAKKNKGKQNAPSKQTDDDNDEQQPDDIRNDDSDDVAQSSDADGNDNAPAKTNKQKGKVQNNQKQGGGGGGDGGKGGKGQKLTPAQQMIKLLAEAKIREDRQKAEETEKERLYKHMESYFKNRKTDHGFGSTSREMTTLDWLKKIEREIEERNKKKDGKGILSSYTGSGGWGATSSKRTVVGWGDLPAGTAKNTSEWGFTDEIAGNAENNLKSSQKDKGKQSGKKAVTRDTGIRVQANNQADWNASEINPEPAPDVPQDGGQGWGEPAIGTTAPDGSGWGGDTTPAVTGGDGRGAPNNDTSNQDGGWL